MPPRSASCRWLSELYDIDLCECSDARVIILSFAHTLSRSTKTTNQLVLSLMGSLTPEGR
ncbi:hypothetical protein [Aeromonas taiwanensis]|uniref:hypothetical protein n=1 Tax=Aeromonas taiwanensis TaxID=633417 RepID=UPI00338E51E3